MDDGLTEHSGCPVLEGDKWIATAWIREGVSDAQPWTIFEPVGIEVLELHEQQDEEREDEERGEVVLDVVGNAADFADDEF